MKSRLTLISAVLSAFILCGCGNNTVAVNTASPAPDAVHPESSIQIAEGKELLALADSEEDAKEIAELYGIEFVEFSYGVATFHTDEDLSAVIKRGQENNWPALEINHISHAS